MLGLSLCFATIGFARPLAAGEHGSPKKAATRHETFVVKTPNFRIYGISRLPNARAIGESFERLRGSLARTWLGERRLGDWSPKCDVVVHATAASYALAVGQDQFATAGSSRVDTTGEKITLRRLDIRADKTGWFAAAVPHELTHLVMADEFLGRELPVWADEGMAVLADAAAKQSLHLRDFSAGQRRGSTFRLASLVGEGGYPSPDRIPVFYGQSVSLVKYLIERRSPADFVRFLHLAGRKGYDAALAEVYGFAGVESLEREWLTASTTVPASNVLTAATAHEGDWPSQTASDG